MKEINEIMNVVIYARYSSEKQNEQSIEGQLDICNEFASRNGYTVIGKYIDKALSGKTDNRPEFKRMIEDSNKKQFQGVLVYKLDRFARNRFDSAKYKAKLKKNGVRVISAMENISQGSEGIILESVLEGYAEYYSVNLSENVVRGMEQNAQKCLSNGGTIPFGYKSIDKRLQLNEDTAPIVQKIFEMYADGKRVVDITKYLNGLQIKTSSGADFNDSSLHTMLKNRKYLGYYIYNGTEIKGGIPQIIDEDLFNRVAEIMQKNKKSPARARAKEEYILTTKLFCGHCKSLMVGISGTSSTGKTNHYYSCNNARKKLCNKKNVRKDYLENLIIKECRAQLSDKNIDIVAKKVANIGKKEKDTTNARRLSKAINDNKRKHNNLIQAVAECEIDSVRKSLYTEIANLEKTIILLEREMDIERVQHFSPTEEEIRAFLYALKNGDEDDINNRKALINTLVNAIYLYDDEITFVFNSNNVPVTINVSLIEEIEQNNEEVKRSYIDKNGSPVPKGLKNRLNTMFSRFLYTLKRLPFDTFLYHVLPPYFNSFAVYLQ